MSNLDYNQTLTVELAKSLADVTFSNTAQIVSDKIEKIKTNKSAIKQNELYEEIINELLHDKSELIRISSIYKEQLENMNITDDEIQYLHKTVNTLFQLIPNPIDESTKELALTLLSVETLKTMQLLGFNYKEAIGQPLTNLCANAIGKIGSKKKNNKK